MNHTRRSPETLRGGEFARSRPRVPAWRARHGMGLLDAVAMMSIVGLLLSLSAVVLNRAFAAHSLALKHFHQIQNLQQAGDRLLGDVHAADSAQIDPKLVLFYPQGRKVVYEAQESQLIRETWIDGQTVGRELWELPYACDASWSIDAEGAVRLLHCELDFSPIEVASIRWTIRLGIDRAPDGGIVEEGLK